MAKAGFDDSQYLKEPGGMSSFFVWTRFLCIAVATSISGAPAVWFVFFREYQMQGRNPLDAFGHFALLSIGAFLGLLAGLFVGMAFLAYADSRHARPAFWWGFLIGALATGTFVVPTLFSILCLVVPVHLLLAELWVLL